MKDLITLQSKFPSLCYALLIFALFSIAVRAIEVGLNQVAIVAIVVLALLILSTKYKNFKLEAHILKFFKLKVQVDSQSKKNPHK